MADYPAGVYSPRTKANRTGVVYDAAKTTVGYVEDVTKLDAEVVAVETELGANPKGASASVAARLSAIEGSIPTLPVKASGAEIDTGTDDAKFATPKAIADSGIAFTSDIPSVPVKATGAEIDTGTDDAKFATAKAIRDSGVLSGAVAGEIMGLTDKATPLDADVILAESDADANAKRKITWAHIKSVLKTYFDGIYLALSGGTLTGEINLGENFGLTLLTGALSGDEKYSGIVITGTAGATIAVGDLCELDVGNSRWRLADAGVITGATGDCRGNLGICVLAANDAGATKMLVFGKVRSAAFPAFTVNAQYFVSETAGDITATIPTSLDHAIRCVGYALTAEDLFFNPSPDNITRIA